jgi:hypothetical protein
MKTATAYTRSHVPSVSSDGYIPPKVSLMELNNVEVGRCEYTADGMVNIATERILKLSISRAVR